EMGRSLEIREPEQERHRDVDARFTLLVEQQLLERDRARIAEHRNRFRALPLDLRDHRIERLGVAGVVVRLVEPYGDPRRPGPVLAGRHAPSIERVPGLVHAPARRRAWIWVVEAELEARLGLRQLEPLDARLRQRELYEADLVRQTRMLPV